MGLFGTAQKKVKFTKIYKNYRLGRDFHRTKFSFETFSDLLAYFVNPIKNYGCFEVGVLNTSATKRPLHSNLIVTSLLHYPIELFFLFNNNNVILIMMLSFLLCHHGYSIKETFFRIY